LGVPLSLKEESGGLSASIFSKKKRISASIPNAAFSMKRKFQPLLALAKKLTIVNRLLRLF
jgi:hypothetical protein